MLFKKCVGKTYLQLRRTIIRGAAKLHIRLYRGIPRKAIAFLLIAVLSFMSAFPALAFAAFGTITIPSAAATTLGSPPFIREGELFAGPPAQSGTILNANRYFTLYSITLTANQAYRFSLENIAVSDGNDGYAEADFLFFLTDNAGTILQSSVEAGALGAGIELRQVAPATGTYFLVVSSVAGDELGQYILSASIIPNHAEITGTVRNNTNQLLPNILVTAYRRAIVGSQLTYLPEYSTITQANGTFLLSPLLSGDYIVSFSDLALVHSSLYYSQAYTQSMATPINLEPGARRSLSDAVLTPGATITGNVESLAGTALGNITVTAYTYEAGNLLAVSATETDGSGNYALTGLGADSYYISFYCPEGNFISQFYYQATSIDLATTVPTTLGTVSGNINARMRPAAQVSGTVRDNLGNTLEDIVVSLLRLAEYVTVPTTEDCFEVVAQTMTAPAIVDEQNPSIIDDSERGMYFFGGLEVGTYFLHFSDPEGRFLDVYYLDGLVPARAGPVNLNTPSYFTGRDVSLIRPASMAGTVINNYTEPLEGIQVALFNTQGAPAPLPANFFDEPAFETLTEADGSFSLTSLHPGTYIIQFLDLTGAYTTLFHYQQTDPNLANRITITPGTHSTIPQATLRTSSQITGTLQDLQTGLPLEAAQVFLFENPTNLVPIYSATTAQDGTFSFSGLDAGTYYLGYVAPGYTFPADLQFFDEVFALADSTPITVGIAQHVDLDTLYWVPFPTFTITLIRHNSQTPLTITVRQGREVTTLPTPERWGHRFEGWHNQATGGTRIQAPLTPTADTTLHAQWRVADFIFTFNSHGGSAVQNHFFYFGDRTTTFPVPIRPGFEFVGWFDRPVAGFRVLPGELVTNSRTLHAQWRAARHTVTFNSQGGSAVSQRTITHAQTVGNLPTPRRANHNFVGWFSAPTGGARITPNQTITQNTTLHARWERQRVNLRLDTRGGRALPNQSREVGTRIGNLPRPQRPNRVFLRWTHDAAGRRPVNANTVVTNNMTLFAQWRSNDAHLRGISRSAGTLNRRFVPNRFNYRLNLRARTTWVRITPQPRDSEARLQMRTSNRQSWRNIRTIRLSIPRGQVRTVQIRVTSEDRREVRIYRVAIRRAMR